MKAFRNEPYTDFSIQKNANKFHEALAKIKSELNKQWIEIR